MKILLSFISPFSIFLGGITLWLGNIGSKKSGGNNLIFEFLIKSLFVYCIIYFFIYFIEL